MELLNNYGGIAHGCTRNQPKTSKDNWTPVYMGVINENTPTNGGISVGAIGLKGEGEFHPPIHQSRCRSTGVSQSEISPPASAIPAHGCRGKPVCVIPSHTGNPVTLVTGRTNDLQQIAAKKAEQIKRICSAISNALRCDIH